MNKTLQIIEGIEDLKSRVAIFYILIMLAGFSFGVLVWSYVDFMKVKYLKPNNSYYSWTDPFYHPLDASLINYISLCIALGVIALAFYLMNSACLRNYISEKISRINLILLVIALEISCLSVLFQIAFGSLFFNIMTFLVMQCLPIFLALISSEKLIAMLVASTSLQSYVLKKNLLSLKYRLEFLFAKIPMIDAQLLRRIYQWYFRGMVIVSLAAFMIVIIELAIVVIGPTYLINEFPDISSQTYYQYSSKEESYSIDNNEFLSALDAAEIKTAILFYTMISLQEGNDKLLEYVFDGDRSDILDIFIQYYTDQNIDATAIKVNLLSQGNNQQDYLKTAKMAFEKINLYTNISLDACLKRLPILDVDAIQQFYQKNKIEYAHLNMGRGQLNHIGHILNPINEMILGKPSKDIFLQYGLGNTLFFKWTMELWGGVSIQNYYKTYIIYIIYYLIFFVMLWYLFEDKYYAFFALLGVPIYFFLNGYIGLILAPGFNPIRHFFDAAIIFFLVFYLRKKIIYHLLVAGIFALLGIWISQQFGLMISMAFLASIILYYLEHTGRRHHFIWLTGVLFFVAVCVGLASFSSNDVTNKFTSYFFNGYFTWKPSSMVIYSAIAYLVISYAFMVAIKDHRFYLKYVYVFVLIYVQGILTYYFWSGLLNHLPISLLFIILQIYLMLFIFQEHMIKVDSTYKHLLNIAKHAITIALIILALPYAFKIYTAEKSLYLNNFRDHNVYAWNFDRANIVSTANPELINDSIATIRKHSGSNNPKIYIISKYDNILPFISNRYSAMPIFELSSFLFSSKESDAAIERLKYYSPTIIFVDTTLDKCPGLEWVKIYSNNSMLTERMSRCSRYALLADIFHSIESDYEKIDGNAMISVYRRK